MEPPSNNKNKAQPRWICTVALAERDGGREPFPGPAGGLVDGSTVPPSFARKKDAKQYAARCAIEWLRAQGHLPDDGSDAAAKPAPATASSSSVAPKAAQVIMAESDATSRSSSSSASMSMSTSAAASRSGTPVSGAGGVGRKRSRGRAGQAQQQQQQQLNPFDQDTPSSTARVAELCKTLGIPPPTYKFETPAPADTNTTTGAGGLLSGYAEFSGMYQAMFPQGLAHVSSVYGGRAFVRERVAEALLPVLRKMEEDRLEDMRAVIKAAAGGNARGGMARGRKAAAVVAPTVDDDANLANFIAAAAMQAEGEAAKTSGGVV